MPFGFPVHLSPMVFACALGLAASACGARTELATGTSPAPVLGVDAGAHTDGGTGAEAGTDAGVDRSCPMPECAPEMGPGAAVRTELYGASGQQAAMSIAVDRAGNLLVAGNLFGPNSVDFGCGALVEPNRQAGLFVAKLDRCRTCVWNRVIDGANAIRVGVDRSGNVLVIGNFPGGPIDVLGTTLTSPGPAGFVAELDAGGSARWARTVGAADPSAPMSQSQAFGAAVDGTGNVVVTGGFAGSIDVAGTVLASANGTSTFLGKLGPDGAPIWGKGFGPNASGTAVAVDASGNVLLAGSFGMTVDFGCGPLLAMNPLADQPFVAKLGADAGCRFSRSFPATDVARAVSIATDASSNIVVTGYFSASIDLGGGPIPATGPLMDLFVGGFHADGSYFWGKGFGGAQGGNVTVNGAGDVFFEGLLFGPTDFGGGPLGGVDDIFLASLDASGGYRWAKSYGSGHVATIGALAVDPPRVIFAGGIGGGTIDFGCGAQTTAAAQDVFIAELNE